MFGFLIICALDRVHALPGVIVLCFFFGTAEFNAWVTLHSIQGGLKILHSFCAMEPGKSPDDHDGIGYLT